MQIWQQEYPFTWWPWMYLPHYDYASLVVSPATTETWTFKTGGSGGTTVATLVIVYTDSGRGTISSVTKT